MTKEVRGREVWRQGRGVEKDGHLHLYQGMWTFAGEQTGSYEPRSIRLWPRRCLSWCVTRTNQEREREGEKERAARTNPLTPPPTCAFE